MKTVTYNKVGGGTFTVEYDENAPCIVCGEPVTKASMGGTAICPWCDCGRCRYCSVQLPSSEAQIKEHMKWHKQQREKKASDRTLTIE